MPEYPKVTHKPAGCNPLCRPFDNPPSHYLPAEGQAPWTMQESAPWDEEADHV